MIVPMTRNALNFFAQSPPIFNDISINVNHLQKMQLFHVSALLLLLKKIANLI